MIRLYFIGLFVLVFAILANTLANLLGIKTWYDFLNILMDKESSLASISLFDFLWLLILYPLLLGGSAWLGAWIHEQITQL